MNLGLIARILPSLFLVIAQISTIGILQSIDELLRDRTVHVAILHVRSSLGIECLGTLYKQFGTSQLVPTVPLTKQLTGTLIHDEVKHTIVVA